MNQNICSNCQTPNVPGNSFCAGCGQPIAANQGYSGNQPPGNFTGSPNAPGYNPNEPNFSSQRPNQPPAPKKSRMGLWLAILGGVGLLFLMIAGAAIFGVYYFIQTAKQEINFNSSYPTDSNPGNTSSDSRLSGDNSNNSVALTEDEKYRLFYAASKAGEQALTTKISKKIGIIDESGSPTDYYKTFLQGMIGWAMRDKEFVQKINTKQKALDYINSQMSNG